MVQYLPQPESNSDKFARALNQGGQAFLNQYSQRLANQQALQGSERENAAIRQLTGMDLSGVTDPNLRKSLVAESAKTLGKSSFIDKLRQRSPQRSEQSVSTEELQQDSQASQNPDDYENAESWYENLTPDTKAEFATVYPQAARALEAQAESGYRRRKDERDYHTSFSREAEQEAEKIRTSLGPKSNALDLGRNAIESGDLSFFSPDKLADATGIDLFRTAKGSQLITAGKENLLSNMSRASARAQNLWFEQRLNSMFPKIGQSQEANLSVVEMLDGEVALENAYLNEFDRLVQEDKKNYGFTRKDIAKRARDNIKHVQKEIFNRTVYRLKELEEQEAGLKALKNKVGKNVTKGTPLTLAMAKQYVDKFGDNALDVAKKNGYTIPTKEEFAAYQKSPREYREGL